MAFLFVILSFALLESPSEFIRIFPTIFFRREGLAAALARGVRRDSKPIVGGFFDFFSQESYLFGFDGLWLVSLLFRLGRFLANFRVKWMELVCSGVLVLVDCIFLLLVQITVSDWSVVE